MTKRWTGSKNLDTKTEYNFSICSSEFQKERMAVKTLEELMQLMKDTNTQIQNAQ